MTSLGSSLQRAMQWSDSDMSMEEFVEWFKQFPPGDLGFLCVTTTGYLGCDQMNEIGSDELFWIRDISRQQRVVVKDTKGRYLSIPVNYQLNFVVKRCGCNAFDKNAVTLQQLMEAIATEGFDIQSLMIEGNVKVPFNVGPNAGHMIQLGALEYVDVYDEKYLVAHNIHSDGREMHTRAASIPVYMPITLDVAESFECPEIRQHFRQWISQIRRIVDGIPPQPASFCSEIMMLSEKPIVGHYEYFKPQMFVLDPDDDNSDYEQIDNSELIKPVIAAASNHGYSYVRFHRNETPKSASIPAKKVDVLPPSNETVKLPQMPTRPRRAAPATPETKANDGRRISGQPPAEPIRPPPLRGQQLQSPRLLPAPPPDAPQHYEDVDVPASQPESSVAAFGKIPDWKNLKEIPTNIDVATLSIGDISNCLRLLKLEAYASILEEKDVDGQLLLSLDESMLVSDMGFQKFDAMKLIKFIRGWRPKE